MEPFEIVEKIDRLREQRGWTTYRLAEEAGITQSAIFNMHARGTLPSITTLSQLCGAFGISLSEFFSDGAPDGLTAEERGLLDGYRRLSAEARAAVRSLLAVLPKR